MELPIQMVVSIASPFSDQTDGMGIVVICNYNAIVPDYIRV